MPIDRPTYHESWYRIEGVRPRLRPMVQAERQHFRGQLWYVLRDPTTNRFFRLHAASYRLIGLLDGRRTVGQAWALASEALGDEAPTQGEALGLIGQLYTANLLDARLAPDADALFRRHRRRVNREVGGYLMNVLFARFPLLDPDAFLSRWQPLVGWFFGPVGITLWFILMIFGAMALIDRLPALMAQSHSVLGAENLLLLYAATLLSKTLHELGHGFACKRFGLRQRKHGGEVHTLGIMLVVLIPMPYIDASSASALKSKWQRAFIGAAGMYVDLALAAIAAVIWSRSAEGTLTHAFTYNLIFIAGLSTLLFNANPLIKFDGYFILSDLLEIPNLQQRGRETLSYLWKRIIGGVRRPQKPFHSLQELALLLIYAVAAFIYRILLIITITLFVAGQMLIVGVIMALAGLLSMVAIPIGQGVRYLATNPELTRTRTRAIGGTALLLAAPLAIICLLRIPTHGRAFGVAEPAEIAVVYAQVDGRLTGALPLPAPTVSGKKPAPTAEGTALVQLEDPALTFQLQELQARRRELRIRRLQAATEDPAAALPIDSQITAVDEQIANLRQDLQRQTVRAPLTGVWIPADRLRRAGDPLQRGDELGTVASANHLWIRAAADQYLGPRLAREVNHGDPVTMRVHGDAARLVYGKVKSILPAGQRRLPSPALGATAGGPIATDPEDSQGLTAAEPYFEIMIELEDPQGAPTHPLLPGQRVVARFRLENQTLLHQIYLATRQVLQERFHL